MGNILPVTTTIDAGSLSPLHNLPPEDCGIESFTHWLQGSTKVGAAIKNFSAFLNGTRSGAQTPASAPWLGWQAAAEITLQNAATDIAAAKAALAPSVSMANNPSNAGYSLFGHATTGTGGLPALFLPVATNAPVAFSGWSVNCLLGDNTTTGDPFPGSGYDTVIGSYDGGIIMGLNQNQGTKTNYFIGHFKTGMSSTSGDLKTHLDIYSDGLVGLNQTIGIDIPMPFPPFTLQITNGYGDNNQYPGEPEGSIVMCEFYFSVIGMTSAQWLAATGLSVGDFYYP